MVPTPPTSKVPRLVHPAWHSFLCRGPGSGGGNLKRWATPRISQTRFPYPPSQAAKQSLLLEDKKLEKMINKGLGTKLT